MKKLNIKHDKPSIVNGQTLEVYKIFKNSFSENEARKIITYIEEAKNKRIITPAERKIDHLSTKENLTKLDTKVSDTRSEMIKWMFIFWLGQIGVTVGIILLSLKN